MAHLSPNLLALLISLCSTQKEDSPKCVAHYLRLTRSHAELLNKGADGTTWREVTGDDLDAAFYTILKLAPYES